MLRLYAETEVDWAVAQVAHVEHLLVDQAHLEKKAAAAALSFMFRYPDHLSLQAPLSEVAREELEHFELALGLLTERGIEFRRQKPAPYAGKLLQIVRPTEPDKLLDHLLCNAAVEARSCERMLLLSSALCERDPEVAEFYRSLVGSEARHHELYVDLAKQWFEPQVVEARLLTVMRHEADVLALAPRAPGLHNSAPPVEMSGQQR